MYKILAVSCQKLIFMINVASFLKVLNARGARINIFEQPPTHTRGPGDIANLWVGKLGSFDFGIMRNALKPSSPNKWTRYINARGQFVIPYIFGGTFDDKEHATISQAMLAISQNTCIKFQKRAGEADFVELRNERGEGCYTTVGRVPGKNVVMLETNNIATCLEYDIVIHELMHTIGLWHEQMRYDRDDYIKIHFENIAPIYYTQFEKIPDTDSTTYGIKYDYESVMHYAKDAFASTPGKLTMETLNKDFQDVIGKVTDAAPSDYYKICNIYGCRKCMGKPFKPGRVTGDTNKNKTSNTTLPIHPPPKVVNFTMIVPSENPEPSVDPVPQSTSILPSDEEKAAQYAKNKYRPFFKTSSIRNSNEAQGTEEDEEDDFEIDLDGTVRPINRGSNETTSADLTTYNTSPVEGGEDCHEYVFCPKLITAFNKKFMCTRKAMRALCCQSCFRRNF